MHCKEQGSVTWSGPASASQGKSCISDNGFPLQGGCPAARDGLHYTERKSEAPHRQGTAGDDLCMYVCMIP